MSNVGPVRWVSFSALGVHFVIYIYELSKASSARNSLLGPTYSSS